MWKYLRKRRAIRRYRRMLGHRLRARYGSEPHYTPEQVKRTAVDSGIDSAFICYALALYCERGAFDAYHRAEGETCDYVAMRGELGVAPDATAIELCATDAAGGWFGDSSEASFDTGGFDGGSCGDD